MLFLVRLIEAPSLRTAAKSARGAARLLTPYSIALAAVIALGFALRLFGYTWGFPHRFHVDEELVLNHASRIAAGFQEGSLHPGGSSYGALPLYLLALATSLASAVVRSLEGLLPIQYAPMVYVARLLSAAEGGATIWLTAELGRRLFGRAVALTAAFLLSVCLLMVREAHFGTVDNLLVMLVALALLTGERLLRRGSWRDYLAFGASVALAAATKIVAGLLFVTAAIAVWRGRAAAEGLRRGALRLGAAAILAAAVWLVLNPYALLDPPLYLDGRNDSLLTQQQVVAGRLRVLYTLQFVDTTPYLYALGNWLVWGMGPPLAMVALAGAAYGVARAVRSRSAADVYVLSWLLPYFLVAGLWFAKFIRYALPLMPPLCLLAARFLVALGRSPRRSTRLLAAVLAAITGSFSIAYTLGYLQIYREPDTRLQAAAWLRENVPAGATILVEKDESLFLHREGHRKELGLTGYRWLVWNPYEIDGVASVRYQAPEVSPERTRTHLEPLLGADYIVITDNWLERFAAAAADFPAHAEFYERLFSGEAGYRLIREFHVYPRLGPFAWRDDGAELTFRLFDHPRIWVFRRFSDGNEG